MSDGVLTLETLLRAAETLASREAPRFDATRYTAVVSPAHYRALIWQRDRVRPRMLRGEHVPADEQHPPVTADRLRERIAAARATEPMPLPREDGR